MLQIDYCGEHKQFWTCEGRGLPVTKIKAPSDKKVANFWTFAPRSGCRCKSDTMEALNSDFFDVSTATANMLKIFRKKRALKNWRYIFQFISEKMNLLKQLAEATRVRNQLL